MGYRAEKIKIEEKLRLVKTICLCVLLTALLGLCVFSAFVPPESWKYYVGQPSISVCGEGELRLHFLDVGQGDCTIVELPDGRVVVIDGGDGRESTETTVIRYLNALKIDVIDALIITHADADHCGSLDRVLKYKTILNAYLPATKPESAGEEYAEFYAQLLKEECRKYQSKRYLSLGGENYTFSFLYPYSSEVSEEVEEENVDSAVLWLDYCGVSVLFTGDAPFETEEILMRDDGLDLFDKEGVTLSDTEILKVAHHGSKDSTSFAFLNYLGVETAVISCGKGNEYGHPSKEVNENLSRVGASVYRTDQSGSIVITINQAGEYFVS